MLLLMQEAPNITKVEVPAEWKNIVVKGTNGDTDRPEYITKYC
jgi:hypothetical protein